MSVKVRNCQFFRKLRDYLRHVLLPGRIAIANDAVCAITDAKFPEDITQLRYFLGACNVYHCFIKDFSQMDEPLTRWFPKDVNRLGANPPDEQRHAFDDLKPSLVASPSWHSQWKTDPSFSKGLLGIPNRCDAPPATRRRHPDKLGDNRLLGPYFDGRVTTLFGFQT